MKPITEQERQSLIEYGTLFNTTGTRGKMNRLVEIALASLTADSVMQVIYNNPHEEGYVEWVDCNEEYFKGVPNNCKRIVYTATPGILTTGTGGAV